MAPTIFFCVIITSQISIKLDKYKQVNNTILLYDSYLVHV